MFANSMPTCHHMGRQTCSQFAFPFNDTVAVASVNKEMKQ